jgi:hypothetical protein
MGKRLPTTFDKRAWELHSLALENHVPWLDWGREVAVLHGSEIIHLLLSVYSVEECRFTEDEDSIRALLGAFSMLGRHFSVSEYSSLAHIPFARMAGLEKHYFDLAKMQCPDLSMSTILGVLSRKNIDEEGLKIWNPIFDFLLVPDSDFEFLTDFERERVSEAIRQYRKFNATA